MERLQGQPAAPGAAIAPAFLLSSDTLDQETLPERRQRASDEEVARLDQALTEAADQLAGLAADVEASTGTDEAAIFEAHAAFATDPELRTRAVAGIEEGDSAERAAASAFDTFRELLAGSSNEYLAARADDLDDVRDRVVRILLGRPVDAQAPTRRCVLVARELTPSQTAGLPRELIAGIVTQTGSATSHAAILARAAGIPAVVGCAGLLRAVAEGTELVVDGDLGAVTVDPDAETRKRTQKQLAEQAARREQLAALSDRPGQLADGQRIELAANIGGPDDLPIAVEHGAEGSGLVRTELLFQQRKTAPTVDEQVRFYAQVLSAFPGHRVVFRTMDVGADKPLPFVERDDEDNPALGLRGLRLHLARTDLFRDQLRALLRARSTAVEDAGTLAVMFPMVATVKELDQALGHLQDVADEEGQDIEDLEVGIMVEIPAAALAASAFAPRVSFLSIGTNDLLQYLFAADRLQAEVAHLADIWEPAALTLLDEVTAAGRAADAWVGVCGETASDPLVGAALVGLGVTELSMTATAIPEVKQRLLGLTQQVCAHAIEHALAEGRTGPEVRQRFEEHLTEAGTDG